MQWEHFWRTNTKILQELEVSLTRSNSGKLWEKKKSNGFILNADVWPVLIQKNWVFWITNRYLFYLEYVASAQLLLQCYWKRCTSCFVSEIIASNSQRTCQLWTTLDATDISVRLFLQRRLKLWHWDGVRRVDLEVTLPAWLPLKPKLSGGLLFSERRVSERAKCKARPRQPVGSSVPADWWLNEATGKESACHVHAARGSYRDAAYDGNYGRQTCTSRATFPSPTVQSHRLQGVEKFPAITSPSGA